ncbi:MAG: archease [bacterium]|jgi:SHS2 domain-containing protein
MTDKGFDIIDHTADVAIKVWADNLVDLFTEAAKAMVFMVADRTTIKIKEKRSVRLEAESREELFLRWLKEILYIMEKEEVIFSDFHIENNNFSSDEDFPYFIQAVLKGEKVNPVRHGICTEIKAVTRHNFFLKKEEKLWKTFVLFDI